MSSARLIAQDELQSVLVKQLTKLLPSAVTVREVVPVDGHVDVLIEIDQGGTHRRIALEVKSRGHVHLIYQAIAQLRRHLADESGDLPMVGSEYMPSR